jgi:hypothetical protein
MTTKAFFSELLYDSQSERWNQFELPKLSLGELQALCKLLGCPCYGTKEILVVRLLAQRALRLKLVPFTDNPAGSPPPCAANHSEICAAKPVSGDRETNALSLPDSSIGAIVVALEEKRF